MRLATRVGWVTGLVGIAASLAVATHGIGALRARPIPLDLMLPFSPREAPRPVRGDHPPVQRVVSTDLPAWFGDAAATPSRIAGTVMGAPPGTAVRLGIDVPDPGIWAGRDTVVAADGSFDFGPIRRGKYAVVASGGALMSYPLRLDTVHEHGDALHLYVYPCRPFTDTLSKEARDTPPTPAPGVAIELAGRVIATTDASGTYHACAMRRSDLQIHAPGYEAAGWFPEITYSDSRGTLQAEYVSSGTVLDIDGSRAAAVGVQPIWRIWSDTYPYRCVESAVVVTTDADGDFTFGGRSSLCGIRVYRGTTVYEATSPDEFSPSEGPTARHPTITSLPSLHDNRLIVRLPGSGPLDFMHIGAESLSAPLGVWVRGHVLRAGAAMPDTKVFALWSAGRELQTSTTRTRSDGSFQLFVSTFGTEQPKYLRVDAVSRDAGFGRNLRLSRGESADDVTINVPANAAGCEDFDDR
jgi:hypothetical protein